MEVKHKKTLLAQAAKLFLIGGLSLYSFSANAAWSTTENYLDSALTYKEVDSKQCFQASPKSLLVIFPRTDMNGKRSYSVSQFSDFEKEKEIYATPIEDQVKYGIVATSFCKGVATISNMNLPFAKGADGVMDANDGMIMLNTVRHDLLDIMDQLNEMTDLAVKASSGTYSSSQLHALDVEFSAHLAEVNHIAAMSHFNGIQLLDGSQATVKVPTNNGKSFVNVNLPNMSTGTSGLGIATLDVMYQSDAQTALMTLNSITTTADALANIKADIVHIAAAAKHDETITTVDMTKEPFVVQTKGPSA